MKFFCIITITLLALISCKSEKNSLVTKYVTVEVEKEAPPEIKKTIPKKELKLFDETDKIVSLPRVSLDTINQLKLYASFSDKGTNGYSQLIKLEQNDKYVRPKSYVRSKLIANIFNKVKVKINNFDEDIYYLDNWSYEDQSFISAHLKYLKNSQNKKIDSAGHKVEFRIKLSNLKKVDEISNVDIELYLEDKKLKSINKGRLLALTGKEEQYKLKELKYDYLDYSYSNEKTADDSKINETVNAIINKNHFLASINNFVISGNDVAKEYRKLYNDLVKERSKIIISTPIKDYILFASTEYPLINSLKEYFKSNLLEVDSSGNIQKLNEYKTGKHGKWYRTDGNKNIKMKPVAGVTYSYIYVNENDISGSLDDGINIIKMPIIYTKEVVKSSVEIRYMTKTDNILNSFTAVDDIELREENYKRKRFLRKKLVKGIAFESKGEIIKDFDENYFYVSSWNLDEISKTNNIIKNILKSNKEVKYKSSHHSIDMNLSLKNFDKIAKVSNISGKVFIEKGNSLENLSDEKMIYNNCTSCSVDGNGLIYINSKIVKDLKSVFHIEKTTPKDLSDIFSSNRNLIMSIDNYNIYRNNNLISYEDYYKQVRGDGSKIVISTPDEDIVVFAIGGPSKTIIDFFEIYSSEYNTEIGFNDNGELTKFGKYEAGGHSRGKWIYIGERPTDKKVLLEKGKTYTFAFVTKKEIDNAKNSSIPIVVKDILELPHIKIDKVNNSTFNYVVKNENGNIFDSTLSGVENSTNPLSIRYLREKLLKQVEVGSSDSDYMIKNYDENFYSTSSWNFSKITYDKYRLSNFLISNSKSNVFRKKYNLKFDSTFIRTPGISRISNIIINSYVDGASRKLKGIENIGHHTVTKDNGGTVSIDIGSNASIKNINFSGSIINDFNSGGSVDNIISKNRNFLVKVDDFNIDYDYYSISYKDLYEDTYNERGKIIVSTPEGDYVYFAKPGMTILSALQKYFKERVEVDSRGNITSIKDYRNMSNSSDGKWYTAESLTNVYDVIKKSTTYALVYAEKKDFSGNRFKVLNTTKIEDQTVNDLNIDLGSGRRKIFFKIKGHRLKITDSNQTFLVRIYKKGTSTFLHECNNTLKNRYPNEQRVELNNNDISKRVKFYIGGKLISNYTYFADGPDVIFALDLENRKDSDNLTVKFDKYYSANEFKAFGTVKYYNGSICREYEKHPTKEIGAYIENYKLNISGQCFYDIEYDLYGGILE